MTSWFYVCFVDIGLGMTWKFPHIPRKSECFPRLPNEAGMKCWLLKTKGGDPAPFFLFLWSWVIDWSLPGSCSKWTNLIHTCTQTHIHTHKISGNLVTGLEQWTIPQAENQCTAIPYICRGYVPKPKLTLFLWCWVTRYLQEGSKVNVVLGALIAKMIAK